MSDPLAWAVLLSDGRPYGRYDFCWEAQAIADALLAHEGVSATVVPLYPTLTDAEREAVEAAAHWCAEDGGYHYGARGGHIAATLRGLLERTRQWH